MASSNGPADDETTSAENAERSRKRTRRAIAFFPGLLLVGLLAYGLLSSARDHPAERTTATSFDLPRLSGAGSVSSEALAGKPVVLNFWASWCVPCKEEMPAFEQVWQRYRDRVTIVGVNVQDSPDAARQFANEIGVTYPLVTDPDNNLSNELHVMGLPQTFFFDARLRPVGERGGERELGAISVDRLEAKVESLLERDGD